MGFFREFLTDPLDALLKFIALVTAIGFHEFSHVLVAYTLGDPTGKQAGRLTLNPLAHLHPVGTLMIFFAGIGFGRPAPFNPEALRYRRFGPTLVALGGPVSNLFLVVVFGLLGKLLLPVLGGANLLIVFLVYIVFFNAALAVFNLLPIPPLDGSHLIRAIFGPESAITQLLERYGVIILLLLLFMSLAPGSNFLSNYISGGVRLIFQVLGI